jgi:hypothetical protein
MMLRISAEASLLRVAATGRFSLREAKRTFVEVLGAVASHHSEKVLFDGRELKGEPTFIQRFYYGEFAADAVRKFRIDYSRSAPKFAYVLIPPVLDPNRFGEIVAVNRGMNVKAFDNIEDALGWLRLPQLPS